MIDSQLLCKPAIIEPFKYVDRATLERPRSRPNGGYPMDGDHCIPDNAVAFNVKYKGEIIGRALVDRPDADLARYRWKPAGGAQSDRTRRYLSRGISGGGEIRLHREVMRRALGHDIPAGMDVDHVNGVVFDCRRVNLRLATRSQNMANSSRARKSLSGYRGVVPWGKTGRFAARIKVDYRVRKIGLYDTAVEAARAYDLAAIAAFGEFATLNFPAALADIAALADDDGQVTPCDACRQWTDAAVAGLLQGAAASASCEKCGRAFDLHGEDRPCGS